MHDFSFMETGQPPRAEQSNSSLKPLKRCKCGTGTNNDECAWCRIVADVGYDMQACREGNG